MWGIFKAFKAAAWKTIIEQKPLIKIFSDSDTAINMFRNTETNKGQALKIQIYQ